VVLRRLTISLVFLFACARQPKPSDNAPPPALTAAEITIVVKNQHWLDINIYLIRGTYQKKLGVAGSLSTKVFSVSWSEVGGSAVRLGADPIGDRTSLSTELVAVRPSSVVEWTIGSGLRQSIVSVF
jgi:hypothetical protein